MTANELKKATVKYLSACGWNVWRENAGYSGRYNVKLAPAGTSDLVGWDSHGYFVGIEIKIGADSLRPAQEKWLEALNATQFGYGVVITCIEDVIEIEKERG